jgi:hypothetical protein
MNDGHSMVRNTVESYSMPVRAMWTACIVYRATVEHVAADRRAIVAPPINCVVFLICPNTAPHTAGPIRCGIGKINGKVGQYYTHSAWRNRMVFLQPQRINWAE